MSRKDTEWLEYELEQYKTAERYRQEQEAERRRQREQERQEYWQHEQRSASTWPEALRKQRHLFGEEAAYEADYGFDEQPYFTDGKNACERALELWKTVEATKAAQIAELEAQIAAVKASIRLEVAELLDAESDKRGGWQSVVGALKEYNEDEVSIWLNW